MANPEPDFWIKQGDLLPAFEFTCQDANKAAVLIQGASEVRFLMRSQATGAVKVNALATNLDDGTSANKGKGRYDWSSGDTDTAGWYEAEVQVTFANGRKETFPNGGYALVLVKDDIA